MRRVDQIEAAAPLPGFEVGRGSIDDSGETVVLREMSDPLETDPGDASGIGVPNFANRTLFHGDNLPFLQHLNSNSVHLIYADPPFNKNRDFHTDPESVRAGVGKVGFTDRWKWDQDVQEEWVDDIKDDHPKVWQAIAAGRVVSGDDMGAYLCWLGVRLIEMHRVLRDDGSIYLHLDHTAHAYAKLVMDAIFGPENFRNTVSWRRNDGRGKGNQHRRKKFGTDTDTILYYAKSPSAPLSPYRGLTDAEAAREFRHADETGRMFKWGVPVFRSEGMAPRPNLCFEWRGFEPPFASGWRLSETRLEEEYRRGNIVIDVDENGERRVRRRMFLDDFRGRPLGDLWSDISRLTGRDKESVGYPTQKPLKLLRRIITASSREGDIVLDPFCGCATTPIAAEQLNRQWVGADIWTGAYDQVVERLSKEGIAVPDKEWEQGSRQFRLSEVTFSSELPTRTDDGDTSVRGFELPVARPLEPWQKLTHAEIKIHLILAQTLSTANGEHGLVTCAGCGRLLEHDFMELDHITPQMEFGRNSIDNRILLCAPCNKRKSRYYTLPGLQRLNAKPDGGGRVWMQDNVRARLAYNNAREVARKIAAGVQDHQLSPEVRAAYGAG